MSLIDAIKEKVANPKAQSASRTSEEQLQQLDSLIEELFKLDKETNTDKVQEKDN